MVRVFCLALIVCVAGLAAYGAVTLYDESMQVGRMWETPAIKPHEAPIPVTAAITVPFDGSEALLRAADPDSMQAPFPLDDARTVALGEKGYRFYCIQCHGRYHDGNGTVGQSFAPLPGDLRSARVQSLAPGRLFHEISYGIPGGRQPALASTVAVAERWQIIGYIQSLGRR